MWTLFTCSLGINVLYYWKSNMCDHKEIYIGKTVGDVVSFEIRMSQNISECIRIEICSLANFQYKYIIVPWKTNL